MPQRSQTDEFEGARAEELAPQRNEKPSPGLPTLTSYLAGLPHGWRSYPECEARASMLGRLSSIGILSELDALPADVRSAIHGIGETDWIPEVVHVGVLLALRDLRFGPSGEEAFLAWLAKLNREIMPERVVGGPMEAARQMPRIWAELHRGTTLVLADVSEHAARFVARHPPDLFTPLSHRWRRHAVHAFLSRAGAVQPRSIERPAPDGSVIEMTWS